MPDLLERVRRLLFDPEQATQLPRYLLRPARYGFVLLRDLAEGQLSMRAMSLVYTTLLSLVPMLALGFSVLKALGVHNSLEPVLLEALAPLGPQAEQITQNVIGFVENIQVGVLGSLGVALLFYAALSMIQKVEASFNVIWRVEQSRALSQRVGEYLAVLTVGPVLVFSALGVTASLLSSDIVTGIATIQPFGFLIEVVTRLLPFALIIGAFTFAYSFMPNTRVRLMPAFIGGLAAGLLWQFASLAFAQFVAGASNYNAIYSGFAIFLFLLIWLYVGWLILLTGCQLAFYLQNPAHLVPSKAPPMLASRAAEFVGLAIMTQVTRTFIEGTQPPTADDLAETLGAPPEHVQRMVRILQHHGLLAFTGERGNQLLPGMDPASLSLSRLWRLIRAGTETLPTGHDHISRSVLQLIDAAEAPMDQQHGEETLRAFTLASTNGDATSAPHSPR